MDDSIVDVDNLPVEIDGTFVVVDGFSSEVNATVGSVSEEVDRSPSDIVTCD